MPANQVLHGEAVNLLAKVAANSYYVPSVADPLAPITFVHQITVPVFLACQWTDEQTGAHCPDLAEHFTGTRRKWFTFTNGTHIDSLDPATFNRWYDFLELFVARRRPALPPVVKALAPSLYRGQHRRRRGDPAERSDPGGAHATRRRCAAFERLAPVRILFDNGAGSRAGRTGGRLRAVLLPISAAGDARPLLVPRPPADASAPRRPRARGVDVFTLEPARAAGHRLHRRHRAAARAVCGPPPRRTTGRRTRRAPRSRI